MHLRIETFVSSVSMRRCLRCDTDTYDHDLADTIAQNLKPKKTHWPPSYIIQHTLRDVLDAIGSLGDYTTFKGDEHALCSEHKATSTSEAVWFERSAAEMNKSAEGLCYVCTREDKHASECEHMQRLRHRMHELDPLDARS